MASHYKSNIHMYGMPPPELMMDPESREHMKKLYEARKAFMSGDQVALERVFFDFYEDISNHQDFWFSKVFSPNSDFCEWTVGILGTLATIRRQRGDVEKCLEVLELDQRVFDLYRNIADDTNPMEWATVRGLTYKYNIIVINANSQMGHKAPAIKAFREAVEYEIEEKYSFDQQNFGFMLLRQGFEEDYMTMECLNSTPDDFIWSVLMNAQDTVAGQESPDLNVEPWICDGCGSVEELCGDYKQCSGCNKAKYCSKACQIKHWKTFHKPECKKKNKKAPKIKITNANLKVVANMLVKNFAKTVLVHTGQEVTLEQKQAAFPGFVQLLKDFLVHRPEFNVSNTAFQDASRDAEFNDWAQKYFEKQPGYEALVKIHQKPEVRAHVAAVVSPDKSKELLVDEETIADTATLMVVPLAAALNLPSVQKHKMAEKVTSALTEYILDHPEYNSYKGFYELRTNEECKAIVTEAVKEVMELEGLFAE